MHRQNRQKQPRRRDSPGSPSARSRSRSRSNHRRRDISRYRHHENQSSERSFTPPRTSGEQEGSESFISISQALLQGINKIASNKNQSGVIDKSIIEEFNPIERDIRDWLNSVDEYSQINNWSDEVTCHLALSKLRGPAETWYRGLPTRLFVWPEWKELLLENFIPKRNLHADMKKMLSCTPKTNQGLYEYTFEKLALINRMKIPLSDSDKVNLIMGDINDNQIRFSVETSEIKNPARLARYLKIFDDNKTSNTGILQPSTSVNLNASSTENLFKTPHKNKYQNKNLNRCFNCREKGHFREQCPKKNKNNRISGTEVANYYNS